MVDKNLFLHDLAVVAVMKHDEPYLKEWLDYHLAAGVDHFYLYDNDNPRPEIVKKILQPYIAAQIVDYFPSPGALVQMPAYNDAIRRFKFVCRYLAFIDLDEFIFPKSAKGIVEVVDEILSATPNAAGLAINWQVFGSNGQEKADLSRGVLERFTRRAPSDWYVLPKDANSFPIGNVHVKSIVNPRYVRHIVNPHYAYYFDGKFAVNSSGGRVTHWGNRPVLTDKIVVNHYLTKSKEEYRAKIAHGRAGVDTPEYVAQLAKSESFERNDRNDEFDDDILTYRDMRKANFTPPKGFNHEQYYPTLEKILSPAARKDTPEKFFVGKLETFLTCRNLAGILRRNFPNDKSGTQLEELALLAINRTHHTKMTFSEIMMMLNNLPQILVLPYPVVAKIHKNCMNFTQQLLTDYRRAARWEQFIDMSNYQEMLAAFGVKIKL